MEKYTYQTYPANFTAEDNDRNGKRVEQATVNFNSVGQKCYTISVFSRMQRIEFEDNCPYPAATMEESAQLDIAALIAQDAQAEAIKGEKI